MILSDPQAVSAPEKQAGVILGLWPGGPGKGWVALLGNGIRGTLCAEPMPRGVSSALPERAVPVGLLSQCPP